MCYQCLGEDLLPRRRFLKLAAVAAAAAATGSLFDPVQAAAAPRSTFPTVAAPTIITREQWGADETIRDGRGLIGWSPFRKIVIHHTASPNSAKDPKAMVRIGYELHTVRRGYSDIGYHFLIGPKGEIFEGRRARTYRRGELHTGEDGAGNAVIGGHTKGRNAGSCGIALLGTFTSRAPSDAAIASLIKLISWEAQRHKIDPLGNDTYVDLEGKTLTFPNIVAHRGVGNTLCPGTRMAASIPWLRNEVAKQVGRFPTRKADMRRLAWVF